MIVLFLTSLFVVLLTYLEGKGKLKGGMRSGFVCLIFIISIRNNYGNDFDNYLSWFIEVTESKASLSQILSKDYLYGRDNGWSLLYYLFSHFSFNLFIAFISTFIGVVFYKFIKYNISKEWRWLAVFTFLFTPQIFVLGLSMMRQAFAIALFIISYKYISKNKILIPLLLCLIATTIHFSAIITIPFVLINRINLSHNKMIAFLLVLLYFVCIPIANYSTDILTKLSAVASFDEYINTYVTSDLEFSLGLGYILMHIPFLLYINYIWKMNICSRNIIAIIMSCVPFFLLAFKSIPMTERLGYYFVVFSIIAIPISLSSMKKGFLRTMIILLYIAVTIISYFNFFNNPIWYDKYFIYNTIFN